MEEYPLKESLWRRGWNDTKAIWTSWPFYILDAVVAVVIGGVFGWYWGLGIVIFGTICVWMGATARAPIKQRDEARELVEQQRKQRDELSKHSDVKQVVEELKTLIIFEDITTDATATLYQLREQLAVGISEYQVQVIDRPILAQLALRKIIQLEQRRKASGPRQYDEGYWILTEFGKDVILYLETNKQALDAEQSLVLTPHTYAIGLSSMTGYPDKPDNADWLCLEVVVNPINPIDTLDLLIGSETIHANHWPGKNVAAFSVYFNVTGWKWKGEIQVELQARIQGVVHSSGRIPIDFNVEHGGNHRI